MRRRLLIHIIAMIPLFIVCDCGQQERESSNGFSTNGSGSSLLGGDGSNPGSGSNYLPMGTPTPVPITGLPGLSSTLPAPLPSGLGGFSVPEPGPEVPTEGDFQCVGATGTLCDVYTTDPGAAATTCNNSPNVTLTPGEFGPGHCFASHDPTHLDRQIGRFMI
jgi:hypothetical protein